jgi:CheY-like chemotaxis protein
MTRIGLVEDNADNRLLVQAILEDLYEIEEYETGADALEGIRARPPALVLLDISLPAMDGTEVLRRLRADERTRALAGHRAHGARNGRGSGTVPGDGLQFLRDEADH